MTKPKKAKAKAQAKPAQKRNGDEQGTSKPAKTRKSGGDRPSKFTEEIGAEICAAIANGATLTALCEQEGYPCRETVWRWMQAFPAFEDEYLRARVYAQQLHGDEAIDIAKNEEDIARARVMIDARRMVVSRLSSQYAGLIAARTPEAQPFDLAGAMAENRRKIEALIAEVGHERAERIRQDSIIEDACNPRPGTTERMLRGNQRVAMHFLEERKKALLAMPTPDKPV